MMPRVASASASLPMVCPFAIGKAFSLDAATRIRRQSPFDGFLDSRLRGNDIGFVFGHARAIVNGGSCRFFDLRWGSGTGKGAL